MLRVFLLSYLNLLACVVSNHTNPPRHTWVRRILQTTSVYLNSYTHTASNTFQLFVLLSFHTN